MSGSTSPSAAPVASFALSSNVPIRFGVDRVGKLADDVNKLAGEAASLLLVADPGLGALTEHVAGLLVAGGHRVSIFSDIRSDPLGRQVDAAADQARSNAAAAVICLGGGSTLDAGKLVAAVAGGDKPAEYYGLAANPFPKKQLKKICIPTTSGTGSEATTIAVITNSRDEKIWCWGRELKAELAVLDPRLVVGLPPHLTAATGADALVHAIEATTNRNANLMNDAVCLQAIRLIARHLPRAVSQPDDLEARGAMQLAACLAGIGIDNAGTAVAHALGHALGAVGHIHHGRAVAISLRVAISWNAEADPERHAQVAAALGIPVEGRKSTDVAGDLAPAFDAFLRRIKLDISLAGDGLSMADSTRLAETTMAPENAVMRNSNIRPILAEDARRFAATILSAA